VFGRLADGASLESAQTELTAVGERIAAANPATHAQLRPRVLPHAAPPPGNDALLLRLSNIIAWLILAAACANVATLLFARTASREAELVMRTALGASRSRVMMQLVIEALVLSAVAALAGLSVAHFAIDDVVRLFVESEQNARLPFWWGSGIGVDTVLYAAALAIAGAVMMAILPALKATGRRVQASLTSSGSAGTNMRFGGVWSFMIVLQVTMAALCLPLGVLAAFWTVRDRVAQSDFPTHEFLTFRPALDRDVLPDAATDAELRARIVNVYEQLKRRLESEPSVAGVTFANVLPGLSGPLRQVEAQRGSEPPFLVNANIEGDRVRTATVDAGYFATVGLPVLAGRDFHRGDVAAANVVVINETLARNIGGSPVGVRLRYVASGNDQPASPWFEVVGIVRDAGLEVPASDEVFLATSLGQIAPFHVSIRVRDGAAAFAPRLRELAAQVEPGLRLYEVLGLDEVVRRNGRLEIQGMLAVLAITALLMVLSAAGLYALMSVAVTRRTREIGIRITLGATPNGVLAAVFRRAAILVGIGTLVASALLPSFMTAIGISELPALFVVEVVLITAGGMLLTAIVACLVPARKALRIQPAAAVKSAG
jgi:predicted permease